MRAIVNIYTERARYTIEAKMYVQFFEANTKKHPTRPNESLAPVQGGSFRTVVPEVATESVQDTVLERIGEGFLEFSLHSRDGGGNCDVEFKEHIRELAGVGGEPRSVDIAGEFRLEVEPTTLLARSGRLLMRILHPGREALVEMRAELMTSNGKYPLRRRPVKHFGTEMRLGSLVLSGSLRMGGARVATVASCSSGGVVTIWVR
jgi:hypothetical protein